MIECFVRTAREQFPTAERLKLDRFDDAIASTTSRPDAHRARRCAEWAIELANDKKQSHPRWKELKELHQEWKGTWFGLEMGGVTPQGATFTPREDVHIQWVENAVTVAEKIGTEDGWGNAPWEALLDELIAMDRTRTGTSE
jgi:hypothetical protein